MVADGKKVWDKRRTPDDSFPDEATLVGQLTGGKAARK